MQGGAAQPALAPAAFASGEFNRVPVIFGNTRHEARAFVYEANDLVRQPVTAEAAEAATRNQFGDDADRVLEIYPVSSQPGVALAAARPDAGFACNSVPIVAALARWAPTYVYEFRDETSPPRSYMTVPPSFSIGAAHTSDVPYVWQSETASPLGRTQMALARIMLEFWSNFAASGDPNGTALPSWPPSEAQDSPGIRFLAGGQTGQIAADACARDHHCAFWDVLQRAKAP